MDLTLSPAQLELQARARAFVRDVLQPLEAEFERPAAACARLGRPVRQAAIEARLHGGRSPSRLGGQGWTALEQVLVHEQLGQVTGGLWSYMPGAYNVLDALRCGAAGALPRAVPSRRAVGELRDHGGRRGVGCSDAAATAIRDPATGDYVLNGEKWFVTGPDDTDFMIFHANVVDGERRLPTLFLVDYDTPGLAPERPGLHPHVRRPASPVRTRGRAGPGRGDSRPAGIGRRADKRRKKPCPGCRNKGEAVHGQTESAPRNA